MDYSGEYLVKLARKTVETYLSQGEKLKIPSDAPKNLFDKSGVFVTLKSSGSDDQKYLRGCIGRIQSASSLIESTIDSAIDSAINDPRFPQVNENEMKEIVIEVSILTVPMKMNVEDPHEYLSKIVIGKHGLIAEKGFYRGLLLPQVPVEQHWNIKEFLNHTCMKAGLSPSSWKDLNVNIYRFEGIIFTETKPDGKIIKKEISKNS